MFNLRMVFRTFLMQPPEHQSLVAEYRVLPHDAAESVYFRPPDMDALDACFALESSSYPADEAATRSKLEMRIRSAPNVFLLAMQQERIVGFTCGTGTTSAKLTHESMSTHEPEGQLLCIHSVVVAEGLRRKGIATRMLRAYLRHAR